MQFYEAANNGKRADQDGGDIKPTEQSPTRPERPGRRLGHLRP